MATNPTTRGDQLRRIMRAVLEIVAALLPLTHALASQHVSLVLASALETQRWGDGARNSLQCSFSQLRKSRRMCVPTNQLALTFSSSFTFFSFFPLPLPLRPLKESALATVYAGGVQPSLVTLGDFVEQTQAIQDAVLSTLPRKSRTIL